MRDHTAGIRHSAVVTELGETILVASADALVGCYFVDQNHLPNRDAFGPLVDSAGTDHVLNPAGRELSEYLAGERQEFTVALSTSGDDFQEKVWALLREIPFGTTTTYGALASALGDRMLAQRVGQTVGRNPIGVFIPCHRVIGADGSLTGYAGGLDRKRFLLELEEPAEVREARLFSVGYPGSRCPIQCTYVH